MSCGCPSFLPVDRDTFFSCREVRSEDRCCLMRTRDKRKINSGAWLCSGVRSVYAFRRPGGIGGFAIYLCDLINLWGFILPVATFAAFICHAPVMVVYFLLNLDEIGKIPFELIHYRKKRWLRNLTVDGPASGVSA